IDPSGLINWKLVGKGIIGMIANGAMAVGGAILAETGVGAAVGVYGAYQFGASLGNVINGFADNPEGPSGPAQAATQTGMLLSGVEPESREWERGTFSCSSSLIRKDRHKTYYYANWEGGDDPRVG
ncbi:MAG: hypothetical protein JXR40_08080, partial [Pontiellaceae bacterium]|nr:hypothetical protein [Pontiellaceae bacterium]